jgi:hypothetical protein
MFADLARWSAAADTPDFWIAAGIASFAALAAFAATFWFLRKARLIEDTPTSRIRSAAQGYIEVEGIGRLMKGPEIIGPLTTVPCLWWEYRIQEKVTTGSGKNRRTHWRTIASGTSGCLFIVDDDTGESVIDPDGARVLTVERDFWYGHTPRWSGPPRTGWLRLMAGRYRYLERRLARNRPIYALGWFKTVGGAGSDFDTNEEVRQRLVEWKQDQAALVERFDTNNDGVIDMQEWDAARRAAETEVREEQLTRAMQPGVNVLCKPPRHDGRPFLLSAIPQEKLIRRFRVRAVVSVLGFLVVGALAAYMIGARITSGM